MLYTMYCIPGNVQQMLYTPATVHTLTPGRLKVHGGVPLELWIYFDPL